MNSPSKLIPLLLLLAGGLLSGCAQIAVGTDPANGFYYTGFDGKGVQTDVHEDAQELAQKAQTVLAQHGFQTGSARSSGNEQNIDGRNSINGASVRIISGKSGSDATHVEVIATEGQICWNMDYAGQILQDIVQSK